MSKKYISPEHTIRNIVLNEFKKSSGAVDAPGVHGKEGPVDPFLNWMFDRKAKNLAPPAEAPVSPVPRTEPLVPRVDEPEATPALAPQKVEQPEVKSKPQTIEEPTAPRLKNEGGTKPGKGDSSKPKGADENAPKPKGETAKPGKTKSKPDSPKSKPPLFITPGQDAVMTPSGVGGLNVGIFLHTVPGRREFQAEEKREDIVNVPRPKSKRDKEMARHQSIQKLKIDEENKKKAAIIRDAIAKKSVNLKPKTNDNITERYVGGGIGMPPPGRGPRQTPPPQPNSGDSFLSKAYKKTKDVVTDPQTYKNLAVTAGKMGAGFVPGAALAIDPQKSLGLFGVPSSVSQYIPTGAQVRSKLDKSTGGAIDKAIESTPLKSIMPTGKRDETGAFVPDNPKYAYGGLNFRDVLATIPGYEEKRAQTDTFLKNYIGKPLGLSKGTTIDIERKQEKQKGDPYNTKAREFNFYNPGSWKVDQTADIAQMIPYKPIQLAGLTVATARNVARRDPFNLVGDLVQYKLPGVVAPAAVGGYQFGTEYGRRTVPK